MAAAWRYFIEDPLTGTVLAPAVPLSEPEITWELSGPGGITGTIAPAWAQANPAALLDGNALYAEADGHLLAGGLIDPEGLRATGQALAVEAYGWSAYLMYRHDTHGEHGGRGPYVYADPCQIVRNVWAYAQEQPDGDLGVIVDDTASTVQVGTPAEPWHSYWWETPVLGDQVDDLFSEDDAPDYANHTEWNADRTAIVRRLRLGYPRLGRRRTDVSFSTASNIVEPPEMLLGGDYANTVIATGAGEGTERRRAIDSVRDGRLRREAVLALPDVNGNDVLARRAAAERRRRQARGTLTQIVVKDHPNAPIGTWQVGDDVRVTARGEWGVLDGWFRVVRWSLRPGEDDTATLEIKRADSFYYGQAV